MANFSAVVYELITLYLKNTFIVLSTLLFEQQS